MFTPPKGTVIITVALFLCMSSDAIAATPTGAVKLPKSKLAKKTGFYCGRAKGSSWIPGKLLPGGYFYSHQAEKSNLSKQLKKASKSKRKKIQGQIEKLGGLITSRTPICSGGASSGGKLTFDLSGSLGMALKSTSTSQSFEDFEGLRKASNVSAKSSSNLQKFDNSGTLSSVLTSGTAKIKKFKIAPNSKLYVLFENATNLKDTASKGDCVLAEVDASSGAPVCLESELSSVGSLDDENSGRSLMNDFIQFDDAGNIYYSGKSASGSRVLRRNNGSARTDLLNDNISLWNFLVLGNGTVITSGRTLSTNARWIRRILPSGQLSNLRVAVNNEFMRIFPDSNVYFGLYGPGGVLRYFTSTDAMDGAYWIGSDATATNSINTICAGGNSTQYPGFCGYEGGFAKGLFNLPNGTVYGVAGIDAGGNLAQYYPTVALISTSVTSISVAQRAQNYLILAGTNAASRNILTLFNPLDNSESQLLGPDNEIEIYRLNYVSSANKVVFDGLRFSDNKYVIGQYDLTTLTFSATETGSSKLEDLQTF